MNLRTRRAIAFFFIALFLISAPILIIYTAGYRYNFKKGDLQKTGALVIATVPKNASVSLNAKTLEDKTPVRLNNILPDTYEITLRKDNYYPWSKKLEIRPQETTFLEDVLLFYQAEPELLIDQPINWSSFSPANNFAVFSTTELNQNFLYLLNLSNSKIKLLYNQDPAFASPKAIWAPDGSELIFQTDTTTILITNSFPQQTKNLTAKLQFLNPESLTWNQNNNNWLYGQVGNKIYQFNTLTEKLELIHTGDETAAIQDFYVFNETIYTIEKLSRKTILNQHRLFTDKTYNGQTIELKNSDYRFDRFYLGYLGFWHAGSQAYYLVDSALSHIVFTKNNVQTVSLQPQKNLLLIQTNQELSYLNLDQEPQEKNITRYSQGLTAALWHPDSTNYCLALQEAKIHLIELDERSGHNIVTLPPEGIINLTLNRQGQTIFFLKDSHIWQLPLEK